MAISGTRRDCLPSPGSCRNRLHLLDQFFLGLRNLAPQRRVALRHLDAEAGYFLDSGVEPIQASVVTQGSRPDGSFRATRAIRSYPRYQVAREGSRYPTDSI